MLGTGVDFASILVCANKHYRCRNDNTEILRFFIESDFLLFFLLYHPHGCRVKTLLKPKKNADRV